MLYREFPPRPELDGVVRCFWRLVGPGAMPGEPPERVLPDGCAEIVLNRADRFMRHDGTGASRGQAEILLVGQLRRAISIAPSGRVDLLGIRFEPGGLFALLGAPMHELTDLDVCMRQAAPRLHDRLREAAYMHDVRERIRRVEAVLCDTVTARGRHVHAWLVAAAARRLDRLPATTAAVASGLRVSRRSLERSFRECVGLSPKQYLRIRRLQSVVQRLERGGSAAWAAVAVQHGYYDQPHLIREFRALAGTTPARYLAEQPAMADFFAQASVSHSSNPS